MLSSILHIIGIVLCIIFAVYALYFFFFASMSKFRIKVPVNSSGKLHKFTVIFPAYGEDQVIVNSIKNFLKQDYPKQLFQVVVVSDHMTVHTNNILQALPITLAIAQFKESSKAKALNLAMKAANPDADLVVILDADNVVDNDFLSNVNSHIDDDCIAYQAHRTAKKISNSVESYDALSEEINNSIFCNGHIACGLSSRLIGSGMIFTFQWFNHNVSQLSSAGEDKELELLLLKDGIQVRYLPDVFVFDEKVSSVNRFFNQRRRWIGTQYYFYSGKFNSSYFFTPSHHLNWNFIDKIIQFSMPPRLILLSIPIILFFTGIFVSFDMMICWFLVSITFIASCFISLPSSVKPSRVFKALSKLPYLAFLTFVNVFKAKSSTGKFIHTDHGE